MITSIDATDLPKADAYAQASKISAANEIVFISGQVGEDADGKISADFTEQARQVWSNLKAELAAAGMGIENLAKISTVLADRKYLGDAGTVRGDMLAGHRPANSTVIGTLIDEKYLLEIEAIAAR